MAIEDSLAQIDELFRRVAKFKDQFTEQHSFSRQQMLLLITLLCKKRTTVGELAEELGLSTSATTIAINRLVISGHIDRTRDETDRRVVWVELTEPATETIMRLKETRDQILIGMLQKLTAEEQEQFIGLLRKMTTDLIIKQ
ncbi:MarR family winged helix-turn-helix transcriptional regulator [Paenibacillus radicis (ex Xue et al. 2023)]|uniref:MarR family transcriptional regulator n=1 Tax=Paenibacillus radicis (ex Xue et al. 2023) TaxID=2972489 RepID=A0ABT1YKC7_9BACL|nr:MarR family transcriptional regulator [Paenibacillus radicis (ex Xue et al. 2023)]MCR8633640.1 MarR family transcriptional regulator [Paenibacillus radicis (ex Xue et al. 2023)]